VGALYIFALTDRPLKTWVEEDGRVIESVPVENIFAVCERRPSCPAVNEEELRRQHSIVLRIADAAPAVLPARFGSLVDEAELAKIVRERMNAFRDALERVRGNVQMTVRIAISRSPARKDSPPQASGRAYLQRRLAMASTALPMRARVLLASVSALVVDERRKASDAGMVAIYHLVRRNDVRKYTDTLARGRVKGMRVTGPWPAFAFVPDLWS
jgi:hypothetical protein